MQNAAKCVCCGIHIFVALIKSDLYCSGILSEKFQLFPLKIG